MKRRSFFALLPFASAALSMGCNLGPVAGETGDSLANSQAVPLAGEDAKKGAAASSSRILVFGDSITRGAEVGEPYGKILQRMIGRDVVLAGSDGELASSGGPGRIGGVIDKVKPSVVLILEGINDCLKGKSPDAAAAGLKRMVGIAQARGVATVIVGTVTPLTGPQAKRQAQVNALNGRIRSLGVNVADIAASFSSSLVSPDGIHPNSKGHSVIATVFANRL